MAWVNVDAGDEVVCEIDGVGRLLNTLVGDRVSTADFGPLNPTPFSGAPMRIDHLINGQAVAGQQYFETLNPATQDVLAEVAEGGAAEAHAAVAAAKTALSGAWAGRPGHRTRRADAQLGDLIIRHVPEIARTESQEHRPDDLADRQAAGAAVADNFHYFAEMCTRVDGHTYPRPPT